MLSLTCGIWKKDKMNFSEQILTHRFWKTYGFQRRQFWGWGDVLGLWDGNPIRLDCDDHCKSINVINWVIKNKQTITVGRDLRTLQDKPVGEEMQGWGWLHFAQQACYTSPRGQWGCCLQKEKERWAHGALGGGGSQMKDRSERAWPSLLTAFAPWWFTTEKLGKLCLLGFSFFISHWVWYGCPHWLKRRLVRLRRGCT